MVKKWCSQTVNHGEEMVQPNGKRQYRDAHGGYDEGRVAIESLGRKGRKDFRKNTIGGQHQKIDLRVAEQPKQIDIVHHVAAEVIGEKVKTTGPPR
jgi:hypothetical protein